MENNIYIASTLSNAPRVQRLRDQLAKYGIGLTYDWTAHNDGMAYVPDSMPEEKQQTALREVDGVRRARAVLVIMPGRMGTHFEFGMAWALEKPIVWLDDNPPPDASPCFHFLPGLIKCNTESAAIRAVLHLLDPNGVLR